jgi:predicted alpha/beta hydrolase
MAMKIGGEDGIDAVHGRDWRRFAQANRLDPDEPSPASAISPRERPTPSTQPPRTRPSKR